MIEVKPGSGLARPDPTPRWVESRVTSHALLLLGLLALPCAANAQDLVITNARIVDPASRTVTQGALWIENGRIAGRGPEAPANARGARIDVKGRWIVPGFNDLHTHSFGNAAPGNVLDNWGTDGTAMRVPRAGITAFLDLFDDEDRIFGIRNRQRAGEIGGAEIFAAGPCFTASRGHCTQYGTPTRVVESPADARRELAALAVKHPDVVKIVYDARGGTTTPTIDRPTLKALIAAATERGLKTVVHVGTWEDVRHAVLAGATAVTHVPAGEVVPDDLVKLMAENRPYHIPTLTVHTDLAELLERPALIESSLATALASDQVRATYRKGLASLSGSARGDALRQRAAKANILQSVRRLHAAGVPMLTGSDAGNLGVIQGYSVHREMVRLVEAGLSTWDALEAATTRAGEFLGRGFGVQPGHAANLVMLDASPVEDIANTQRIAMVVLRGRVVYDAAVAREVVTK